MIKQAYYRGLMKVAVDDTQDVTHKDLPFDEKDKMLIGGFDGISGDSLQTHGFYKDTQEARSMQKYKNKFVPHFFRMWQAARSASEFAESYLDPVRRVLEEYYQNIGRQNRDFYLKQGFRPPKDHKYKTPFPYPNHPKKKQMLEQNQHQVRNTRGSRDYSRHV